MLASAEQAHTLAVSAPLSLFPLSRARHGRHVSRADPALSLAVLSNPQLAPCAPIVLPRLAGEVVLANKP